MKTSTWLSSFFICYFYYVLRVNSLECVCVPYDSCNYNYSLKEDVKEKHETLFFTEERLRPSCESAIDVCCDLSTNGDSTTVTSQPIVSNTEKNLCGQRGGHHSYESDQGENVDAEFGEFPWTTAVLNKEQYLCGGTLINDEAVLTSAYDIDKLVKANYLSGNNWSNTHIYNVHFYQNRLSPSDLIIRVGQYPWNSKQEDVKVMGVYKHPNFDPKSFVNNYAILILTEPVKNQSLIKPICLPTSSNTYELTGCIETGWGPNCNAAINEKTTLKKTFLDIVDTKSCKQIYDMSNKNDKNQYGDYENDNYKYNNGYDSYGYGDYGYGSYGYDNYGYGNGYDNYGYGNGYGNYRYRRDNYWNDNYRNDKNSIDKSIICATDKNFKTPYTGNGGSPLICPLKDNNKRYVQVGIAIVSKCKKKYKPGLYADVTQAKSWIDQVMNKNNLSTDSYKV